MDWDGIERNARMVASPDVADGVRADQVTAGQHLMQYAGMGEHVRIEVLRARRYKRTAYIELWCRDTSTDAEGVVIAHSTRILPVAKEQDDNTPRRQS